MKIAILIGVDIYTPQLGNLPACKKDVKLIKEILEATGEFSKILFISDNCTADYVKSTISNFISEIKDEQIDEVFFYFTGHGDFYEQQFYYILSDYNTSKKKQTSLENSEVDNWLRNLNPNLTIKVVDACHSGTTYIKSESAINELLEKSTSRFKNCYFMFSSNERQASYQDNEFSFFTRSFLKSLFKEIGHKVRYKDIIDFISDEFECNISQTPIFVTQGTFTEIFCTTNSDIINLVNSIIVKTKEEDANNKYKIQHTEGVSIEKIIQDESKQYCSEEEVENILDYIKQEVEKFVFSSEVSSFFNHELQFQSHDEYNKLPNTDAIGKCIDKNGEYYFAEPTTELIPYETEVPDNTIYGIMSGGYRIKTKYRSEISGFKTTVDLSYDIIKIDMEPKYSNLPPFNSTTAILVSKSRMSLFYFFSYYKEKNWKERKLIHDFKWQYYEEKLKNEKQILETVSKILNDFENYISQYLIDRYKTQE